MIRFEEIDGLYCPVFVCTQCGRPIQGPGQGLIQWDSYNQPTFTVLHKGPHMPCSRQWERVHGKEDWVGWRPLEKFTTQLDYNTRHPFEAEGADA